MWIAQLKAAVIKNTTVISGRRHTSFNVNRVPCRYFVLTVELGSYSHALEWWAGLGVKHQILDGAAAERCAEGSSGVHFSFEKVDRVTCSTICGKFDDFFESKTYRKELVSFAVNEDLVELARGRVSGLNSEDDSDEGESEAAAAEAATANAAAKAATIAVSSARFESLSKRREGAGRRGK